MEEKQTQEIRKGLEGVIAGETTICRVDGQGCRLIYRGYSIDDLVENSTFEEVSYLLLHGTLPSIPRLREWKEALEANHGVDSKVLDAVRALPANTDPMSLLRTAISILGLHDHDAESDSMDCIRHMALSTIAKFPTLVAAIARMVKKLPPVDPKPGLSLAANFLLMLHGKEPTELEARAMDAYLVLLAEHGFNASTFAARVTTGTRADYYSAITSAIGTLKGPLHGAAARWAMEMLIDIGSTDQVESYVKKSLAAKKRFMGFGHRVYKGEDPRAKHLKRYAQELSKEKGDTHYVDICERLQAVVLESKSLYVNVDFYSAPLLHHLGIPTDFFTTLFALSRIAGWSAHIIEQTADNRLIRPMGRYVGAMDLQYVPLGQRDETYNKNVA